MDARDCWEAPQSVFNYFDVEFPFTLDACADHTNFKVSSYSTIDNWKSWTDEYVWCNPPYSNIEGWIDIATNSAQKCSVLLLPVRTSTDWFVKCMKFAEEIHFFRHRIKFIPPPGVEASSPRENHMAIYFRPLLKREGFCPATFMIEEKFE